LIGRLAKTRVYLYYCAFPNSAYCSGVSMANSAQARKRARQAVKQRGHNASLRSALRSAVKKVAKAILAGYKAAAKVVLQESESVIDRIADKKIIHKNKAARHKSRLSAAIKAMA
jgi:small subunit ribosomal protein S20